MNKKYIVRLNEAEREYLEEIVSKGKAAAYTVFRPRKGAIVPAGYSGTDIASMGPRSFDRDPRIFRR